MGCMRPATAAADSKLAGPTRSAGTARSGGRTARPSAAARPRAHAGRADGRVIGGDLLLQREVREQLVDDGDDVEARGEVARDDDAERIALPQVMALVEQHGPQLLRIEPLDEPRRKADPRPDEPVAERE